VDLGPQTIVARAIDESPRIVATPVLSAGAVASVPSR